MHMALCAPLWSRQAQHVQHAASRVRRVRPNSAFMRLMIGGTLAVMLGLHPTFLQPGSPGARASVGPRVAEAKPSSVGPDTNLRPRRPKPLLRGALHGGIAALLPLALAAVAAACASGALPPQWWRFAGLLAGKLASYGASAGYHLFPFRSAATKKAWLRADLTTVSVAVWAPSSAFCSDAAEWAAIFAIACCVTIVNDRIVAMQLSGQALKGARAALLLVFFFWTILVIGWHYGYEGLWVIGSVTYLFSFALAPVLHHQYSPAPWHRLGVNGWHEDFHFVLAIADACFVAMAVQFLTEPHIDRHLPVLTEWVQR